MMPRKFQGLIEGADQTISFPKLKEISPTANPIQLNATTDSGLPVRYYVEYGPAVVREGKLHLKEIPVRARFPIAVEVTAWQPGSAIDPKVKAAEPLRQVVLITDDE